MRILVLLLAVLFSATALAQPPAPAPAAPTAPKAAKPKAATAKPKAAPAKPQSIAAKLQACLEIDDATKERLNCYDTVFPPTPKPRAPAAKAVTGGGFFMEKDDAR